ncbi:hypothetical protein BD779DRAFT_1803781, partial [Infundibulicybe gibba]
MVPAIEQKPEGVMASACTVRAGILLAGAVVEDGGAANAEVAAEEGVLPRRELLELGGVNNLQYVQENAMSAESSAAPTARHQHLIDLIELGASAHLPAWRLHTRRPTAAEWHLYGPRIRSHPRSHIASGYPDRMTATSRLSLYFFPHRPVSPLQLVYFAQRAHAISLHLFPLAANALRLDESHHASAHLPARCLHTHRPTAAPQMRTASVWPGPRLPSHSLTSPSPHRIRTLRSDDDHVGDTAAPEDDKRTKRWANTATYSASD